MTHCSSNGPVMIFGDFNTHLSHGYGDKNPVISNERGRVIEQFVDERRLMSKKLSMCCKNVPV